MYRRLFRSASETKSKKLIDKPWFIIISIISLTQPGSLQYIGLGLIDAILTAMSVALLLYCASFFVRSEKMPLIICLIIYYHATLAIFTLIDSNPNNLEIVKTSGPAVTICMLSWVGIRRNIENYLKSTSIALGLLLVINMVSMILFPGGMYVTTGVEQDINYFLGFDNTFVLWTVPFVFHVAALSVLKKQRLALWTAPCFILAFITESMTWAVTGMFVIGLELIILLLIDIFNLRFSFAVYLVTSVIVFFLVVVVQIQQYFPSFFQETLGKDVSFTGRLTLWGLAIDAFITSPFIGTGISNRALYGSMTHPHCFYLEVAYRGGLLLIIIVAFIFYIVVRASRVAPSKLVAISVACVGSWLICMATDSILHKTFFWSMLVSAVAFSKVNSEMNSERRFA